MPTAKILILVGVFFLTSIVSVVTGSTSLITVPVMIAFGIEPHVAIATNMLALTLMSVGGSVPFLRSSAIRRNYLPASIVLTVFGSALGAMLLLTVPLRAVQLVIAVAMIAVTVFTLAKPDLGLSTSEEPVSRSSVLTGHVLTLALAVYGGFFSGGYVTLLTASFVVFFGMTFLQSVATTKVINVFSSAVATAVFLWRGVVDVKLGIVLGAVMFLGAIVGGRFALKLSPVWLRRIFITAVLGLTVKMLVG
jgi:uncharacterized membrane protein YfcA